MYFGPWRLPFLGLVATVIAVAISLSSAFAEGRRTAVSRAQPVAEPADAAPIGPTRTRFVIGLEQEIDFQVYSLTEPNRVYIELPEVKVQLPPPPGAAPIGLIKSFRGGLSAPGKQRVVLDVTGPVIVDRAVVERDQDGGARLVVDIVEVTAAEAADLKAQQARRAAMQRNAQALGAGNLLVQPPLPRPAVSPHSRQLHSNKAVIVIDPGHGGDDSGAQKHGIVEKDVVLAFSLKLREKLEATGRYTVLLTRSDDTFVELNARREFGEQHNAQLFVAVHADYAQSSARGATIYSLRPEMANALQRTARNEEANIVKKEQAKATQTDFGDVKNILADLYRREVDANHMRTNVFVKSVIGQMGASTGLKDNPDRQAAFVVLKSAKVPSILIELGYVTNAADAQLLGSDAWREKVSTSIATAINSYFQTRASP